MLSHAEEETMKWKFVQKLATFYGQYLTDIQQAKMHCFMSTFLFIPFAPLLHGCMQIYEGKL
jgi:hypothetical protein